MEVKGLYYLRSLLSLLSSSGCWNTARSCRPVNYFTLFPETYLAHLFYVQVIEKKLSKFRINAAINQWQIFCYITGMPVPCVSFSFSLFLITESCWQMYIFAARQQSSCFGIVSARTGKELIPLRVSTTGAAFWSLNDSSGRLIPSFDFLDRAATIMNAIFGWRGRHTSE